MNRIKEEKDNLTNNINIKIYRYFPKKAKYISHAQLPILPIPILSSLYFIII